MLILQLLQRVTLHGLPAATSLTWCLHLTREFRAGHSNAHKDKNLKLHLFQPYKMNHWPLLALVPAQGLELLHYITIQLL